MIPNRIREALFTHPTFSHFPSDLLSLMAPENPLTQEFFYPIFGSNLFPITHHTNIKSQTRVQELLSQTIALRPLLNKEACSHYNGLLSDYVGIPTPHNLNGVCIKTLPPVSTRKAQCKATPDKWSCMGCGKSWVPGSYHSKTCKSHPHPFWANHLQSEIQSLINTHGVSKEAPLVWVNGEARRLFKPKTKPLP